MIRSIKSSYSRTVIDRTEVNVFTSEGKLHEWLKANPKTIIHEMTNDEDGRIIVKFTEL
jgi:hypothetical protein